MNVAAGQILRGLRVALFVVAVMALAASPAGAFRRILKVTSSSFTVGDTGANNVAVDRRGDMFALQPKMLPDAGFDTLDATKVVELSPQGKKIREVLGRVVPVGRNVFIRGEVAVTPNGGAVLFGGGDSSDGENFPAFVGEYSAATGKFIRGTNFDTRRGHSGGAIAVDGEGRHVYVGDWARHSSNRIFELTLPTLAKVRSFVLHGAAASGSEEAKALAIGGPDGDLYVSVGSVLGTSAKTFIQVYRPDGTFVRQVSSGEDAGVAVNPAGQFFSGGRHGLDVWENNGRFRGIGIATAKPVIAEAVDGSDDLFAFEISHFTGSIVKLKPETAQTTITAHPEPLSGTPNATFKFHANHFGATFECRLDRHGFDVGPFVPCSSPRTFKDSPNGVYLFEVRAVSFDGATEPTPATYRFRVGVAYAQAVISSHPAALTGQTTATFTFQSNVPDAGFQCQLVPFGQVQGAFSPCASPISYQNLGHNLYNFEVEAITSDGYPQPVPTEYQFAVDATPPVVTSPAASLAHGEQLGPAGDIPIALRWTATDPNTAAGAIVDSVQERSGQSASALGQYATVEGAGGMGQPNAIVAVSPGATIYQFRALAQNSLGVLGTSGDGNPLRATFVDNADPAVSYSTAWSSPISDAAAVDGTVAASDAMGATATLAFTGTSIGIVGSPGPIYGKLDACIDSGTSVGHCSSVDTNTPTSTERDLVFARDDLTDGPHTIQIRTTSTTPILLDGFVVVRQ